MSNQSVVSSWFTLFRIGNSLTGLIGVLFGSLLALGEIPKGEFAHISILHGVSVWAFMCSWNALNDILDVEIDKLNKPNRPIPSGNLSLSNAKIVTAIMMFISVICLVFAGYISTSIENGFEDLLKPFDMFYLTSMMDAQVTTLSADRAVRTGNVPVINGSAYHPFGVMAIEGPIDGSAAAYFDGDFPPLPTGNTNGPIGAKSSSEK